MEKLFLPSKDEELQTIVNFLIKRKEWSTLEKLMENESDPIRKAYYNWKKERDAREIDNFLLKESSIDQSSETLSKTFKRLPEEMNILIVGEVGVGKSTFINGLVNYLCFSTLNEAMRQSVKILLPVKFSINDKKCETTKVLCPPTILPERDINDGQDNENLEQADSCTHKPKSYLISFGPEGKKKNIRIIDTPGSVATARGNENIQSILNYIQNFKEINAICFLLKPNDVNLSSTFSSFFEKLLSQINEEAAKNILFCFTNSSISNYKIGQTSEPLNRFLIEKRKKYKNIPEINESSFCFENDCFRFLCGYASGVDYENDDIKIFTKSWEHSSNEVLKLLDKVANLKPIKMGELTSLNFIRTTILTLIDPLIFIWKTCLLNQIIGKQKLNEIKKALTDNLTLLQFRPKAVKLSHPQLVCTSPTCVTYRKKTDKPSSMYSSVCHRPCYLQEVAVSRVPNEAIKSCHVFHLNPNFCRVCGCNWKTHIHQRYTLETEIEEVFLNSIDATTKLNNRNKQLAKNSNDLLEDLVILSAFLRQNILKQEMKIIEHFEFHLRRTDDNLKDIDEDLLNKIGQDDIQKYKDKMHQIEVEEETITVDKVKIILSDLKRTDYWEFLCKVQEYENSSKYGQTDDPETGVKLVRRNWETSKGTL